MVYFYGEDRVDGYIKIGKARNSYRLQSRRGELQTGNPHKLILLAHCEGGEEREIELHKQFSHLRVVGSREWYRREQELLDFIEGLKLGEEVITKKRKEFDITPLHPKFPLTEKKEVKDVGSMIVPKRQLPISQVRKEVGSMPVPKRRI